MHITTSGSAWTDSNYNNSSSLVCMEMAIEVMEDLECRQALDSSAAFRLSEVEQRYTAVNIWDSIAQPDHPCQTGDNRTCVALKEKRTGEK